jgi:hypothetical protein
MPNGPDFSRDKEYERLLSEAHLKLGELNGITQVLPDPAGQRIQGGRVVFNQDY